MSGRYRSGRRQPSPAAAEALSKMFARLGFRAISEQVKAEADPEKLRLYAAMALRKAPERLRPELRERLDSLDLT